ncbi:MAG: hypothetical protein ACKV2V_24535 [Blastocatellia bacterium]
MKRKFTVCTLISALLLSLWPAAALADPVKPAGQKRMAKLRTELARLGTGESARVRVTLRDKTKIEGWLGEVSETSFTVVNAATGVRTPVNYPDVGQVKGNNLTTGAKITIAALIGVGVVLAIFLTKRICNERAC